MDTVAINYVKAKEIERYIKDLKILTEKRGSINSFEHTNSVTITDVPEKVTLIKQLIQKQDVATPQVLIEARIVQSNPSYVKELGVIWGSFYSTTKDGGKVNGGADIAVAGAAGGGRVVNLPAPVGAGSGGGINFGYVTNSLQLDVQLTALEKDEKIKIVSSPKVLSLDNKEARIKQGVALPYLKLSEQGVTSTEFKDAVLELKVTPRITKDGPGILRAPQAAGRTSGQARRRCREGKEGRRSHERGPEKEAAGRPGQAPARIRPATGRIQCGSGSTRATGARGPAQYHP